MMDIGILCSHCNKVTVIPGWVIVNIYNKNMDHTPIPAEEIEIFKKLKDLKVIFDVGARTDTDYLEIWPESEFHLFEPNPEFFKELNSKVGDRRNVYLNNFGLGDVEKMEKYNTGIQGFKDGEAWTDTGYALELPIKTLNWYCKENNIKQIDFLKIDAEGYDFKVLIGGSEVIKNCRYIQYEHWDNKLQFHDILENDFIMCYIGFRNVLCVKKGEKWL